MIAAEKDGGPVLASEFWEAAAEAERKGQDKDEWLRTNRTGFICAVCGAKASFVSPGGGRNGSNPPHFRVPGADQCNNHKPSLRAERPEGDPARETKGIINVGGIVTVRYDTLGGAGGGGAPVPGTGGAAQRRGGGDMVLNGGGEPIDRESAGLKSFLSDLQSMPKFPPSTLRVKVEGRGEVWGRDYFCRFEDVSADHAAPLPATGNARLMAYWGKIDAPQDNGSLFLKGNGMSIMVLPKHKNTVTTSLGLHEVQDLKDWFVIAEGRLNEARTGGNFYVDVRNLSKIAFIKPKP